MLVPSNFCAQLKISLGSVLEFIILDHTLSWFTTCKHMQAVIQAVIQAHKQAVLQAHRQAVIQAHRQAVIQAHRQ